MWETTIDGRALRFQLAGVNNQNFVMRDDETGSWWQQVSGECILGPLKGRRLKAFGHDELTFAQWKRETPHGRVLRPDPEVESKGEYEPADWEARMSDVPVATTLAADAIGPFPPRTLVAGVEVGDSAKAYPLDALARQSPVTDTIGSVPVLVVLNTDGKSVRAFERTVDGRKLEFFKKVDASPLVLIDAETGGEWDFTGACTSGALAGKQLTKISALKDYWFNWKTYHPATAVYLLGER